MNVRMIRIGPVFGMAVLLLISPRISSASGDEPVYESLADVNIGKVFFSPEKRQAIDRSRGGVSAASSGGGGTRKHRKADAAGYIIRSDGRTRVYANGDFVLQKSAAAVEFPRQVEVVRGTVADDSEAGNAHD